MSSYIFSIFSQFRRQLLLIYTYVVVVQLLYLIEPYLLGKVVDSLLVGNYGWLFVFLFAELAANAIMYKQMVYDTKIYTSIYNKIVFRYLSYCEDTDTSTKIARTELASNIINFLEGDVQYFIMATISLIGTLFFVVLQDFSTGICIALSILPISIVIKLLYGKIAQSTRIKNNHYETKVTVFSSNDHVKIESFFARRKKLLIQGSTLQGRSWYSLYNIKSVFLIAALLIFTHNKSNLTQGETLAIYSYLNNFLHSLMSIPVAVETYARIRDIVARIKSPSDI